VLLIFGLAMSGRVTFAAMHGVLPVALLTMNAIRNIPPVYLKAARTMHLTKSQTVFGVLLPATLPEVVAGLRIGFTLTLLGVLLAEMFAAKEGLGFLIVNAMQLVQNEEMITVAVVLFAFAAVANALLLWMDHKLFQRA
jgi:NitT/TauT family transport system permease protein